MKFIYFLLFLFVMFHFVNMKEDFQTINVISEDDAYSSLCQNSNVFRIMNPSICTSLFRYRTTDWSACSNGKKTRTLECVDQNNVKVDISKCKFIPSPPLSESNCDTVVSGGTVTTPISPTSSSSVCKYNQWTDSGPCYLRSDKVIVIDQIRSIQNQPCSQLESTSRTVACPLEKITQELAIAALPDFG